jgi:hypothetical protein
MSLYKVAQGKGRRGREERRERRERREERKTHPAIHF